MTIKTAILIIDDDPHLRRSLTDILRGKGYAVADASTAAAALDQVRQEAPAVALVDLKLEDSSGLELMEEIKKRSPGTECIVLTGYASQTSAIEAINLGAYSYLLKPYEIDQVLLTIRRAVETREAETALRESEERFRVMFETSHDLLLVTDERGKTLWANAAWQEALGYTPTALDDLIEKVHPSDRTHVAKAIKSAESDGQAITSLEHRHQAAADEFLVLEITVRRFLTAGEPSLFFAAHDITERVRAEKEILRRAMQQEALNDIISAAVSPPSLAALLETALGRTLSAFGLEMGALWVGSARAVQGLPADIGPLMAQAAQTTGADITGTLTVNDVWVHDPRTPAAVLSIIERAGIRASLTVPILVEGRRTGGFSLAATEPRSWTAEQVAMVEAAGKQVGAAAERLRLLTQVREQAHRIQQTVDTVPEGVILLNAECQVVLANPLAQEYLDALASALATDPLRPGFGERLIQLGGWPLAELLAPPSDELWHKLQIKGPPRRSFELIARLIQEDVKAKSWVLVLRDVTVEREIQQRIQQQARLAAVGQLAAGIAHDFNNIVAVILLYAQMSRNAKGLPDEVRNRLATIEKQTQRATDLIDQILDFGRRSILERRPMNLRPFLQEQIRLLERTLPENIKIIFDYGSDDYSVSADPTRVQQITLSLAVNARDAMPEDGGNLLIKLDRVRIKDVKLIPVPEVQSSGHEWVRMSLSDSGAGIPAADLPRIFEPFFTTKAVGEGSGLGLAQVWGIVQQHDGYIDVTSQVGQGATFTIYLPALSTAAPDVKEEMAADKEPTGRGETILVVEDNEEMREALASSLVTLNYQVVEARNGREALEIFDQRAKAPAGSEQEQIMLVFSDLIMPEMGAKQLARALRQRGLSVPVVVMTGHPLRKTSELRDAGIVDWLRKPSTITQLAQLVARVLASFSTLSIIAFAASAAF